MLSLPAVAPLASRPTSTRDEEYEMGNYAPKVQIDATDVDIVLDDLSKPHMYVAADDDGQLLTAKVYGEASTDNLEEFIDHTLNSGL